MCIGLLAMPSANCLVSHLGDPCSGLAVLGTEYKIPEVFRGFPSIAKMRIPTVADWEQVYFFKFLLRHSYAEVLSGVIGTPVTLLA